jgi:hypothetical protein
LLEAWFKQHLDHVDDIDPAALRDGFAATRFFDALPPVGLMPAGGMRFEDGGSGRATLLQSFFPPLVDCEFSFVPADEVATLVDGALGLPPIDLTASDEDLDLLSVLILAPITRGRLAQLKRELDNVSRIVRPAAPGMLARRLPLESLMRVSLRTPPPDTPEAARARALDAAWQRALSDAVSLVQRQNRGCFYYVRRRQLPYFAEVSSATLRLAGNPSEIDRAVRERVTADPEMTQLDTIAPQLPKLVLAEAYNLFAVDRLRVSDTFRANQLTTSDLLRRSALADFRGVVNVATDKKHAAVLGVRRRYGDAAIGTGFDAMRQVDDPVTRGRLANVDVVKAVANSGVAAELDRAARALPPDKLKAFAVALGNAAAANDLAALRAMVARPAG